MQARTRIKTGKPESDFDKTLEQELLSYSMELARILNRGLKGSHNFPTLPEYVDNAAAILGGLAVGDFYRTGGDPDVVCVVH